MEELMQTKREINKLEIKRQAEKTVSAARKHWLEQLLNWPLKDGPLANRLTKAEITNLGKAARAGKLFSGPFDV
jgi:hypothetical protein